MIISDLSPEDYAELKVENGKVFLRTSCGTAHVCIDGDFYCTTSFLFTQVWPEPEDVTDQLEPVPGNRIGFDEPIDT